MKEKTAKYSIVLLVFITSWGLFQAWNQSKKPFVFFLEKHQNTAARPTPFDNNEINSVEILE